MHFLLRCPFAALTDARIVMLRAIHIAITQAGADFQWADYDRYPELQTHTLLGRCWRADGSAETGGRVADCSLR
jgi:hypothetical protein